MITNNLSTLQIISLAKDSKDKLVEIYKSSTPEQREKIIKSIAGLGGLVAFLKYLLSIK